MKVTLDQNTIQSISLFQNLTGSSVVDAITEGDEIYFVIAQGSYGATVGKGGVKIKNAERVFKKYIKIFEYAENMEDFLKGILPGIQEITVAERTVTVKIRPQDKAKAIGKGGKNVRIVTKFLQRLFDVEELKVK